MTTIACAINYFFVLIRDCAYFVSRALVDEYMYGRYRRARVRWLV